MDDESNNPNPILRLDSRGTILFANPACRALLASWETVAGNRAAAPALTHAPADWVAFGCAVLGRARADTFEVTSGERTYSFIVVPAPGTSPGARYINFYGVDVTERIRTEHALRDSEERYHSLFNGINEGFALHEILCDEQGRPCDYRFLDVNPAFERLTGLKREDVVGRTHNEVLPDDSLRWVRDYGAVALTGTPARFEDYSPALQRHYEVFAYQPAPRQFAVLFMDVTARKQAEQNLRRFELLANHSRDIILFMRRDGRLLEVNAAACQAYGYSREELQALSIHDLRAPGTRGLTTVQMEEADRRGILFETVHRRKDGSTFPVEVSSQGATVGDGRTLISVVRDISERERTAQALRQALTRTHELYEISQRIGAMTSPQDVLELLLTSRQLQHAASASVTAFDQPWRADRVPDYTEVLAYWNSSPGAPTLLGQRFPTETAWITKVQAREGPVFMNNPAADPDLSESLRGYVQAAGISNAAVFPLIAHNDWYGLMVFNSHARDEMGDEALRHIYGLVNQAAAVIHNLRHLQVESEARRAAEQREAHIQHLQQATADLAALLRLDEVAEVILRHGITALGADSGTVVALTEDGRSLDLLKAAGHADEVVGYWRHFPVDATTNLMSIAVRRKAPLWCGSLAERLAEVAPSPDAPPDMHRAWAAIPLLVHERVVGGLGLSFPEERTFSEQERGFMLALAHQCAQALERARLYEAEAAARREAERQNELRLRFLAMISHELRTPLQSIKGFATSMLAQDVTWSPEEQREFLHIIDGESDKLADMIGQLLDLARIESGTLQIDTRPADLGDIISTARPQLLMLAGHHRLGEDIPDDLPRVLCDPQRIAQVLANLVGNAAKYSPPRSAITLSAYTTGEGVLVSVADEGPGIAPQDRPHVFQAFRRGSDGRTRQTKGAGLGLAICKGIVEAHGGRIWIEDRDGSGTTVYFTLPVAG
jgi:PAS domain S-box-containing protein